MCNVCDIERQGREARLAGQSIAESPYLDCPPMLIIWVCGWTEEDTEFREAVLALTPMSKRKEARP